MPQRILLQLDADQQPSSFDSVVAIDAGVDQLLRFGGVTPEQAVGLTHGAIFTRRPSELGHTAIFVGGSSVEKAETIFESVCKSFVGPMRVSAMLDPNGANTTAAAAVRLVQKRMSLDGAVALVLGGSGPVGQRVARLAAQASALVRLSSRSLDRATAAREAIQSRWPEAASRLQAVVGDPASMDSILDGVNVVFACGAAGVRLVSESQWSNLSGLQAVVDVNAVPPLGIEGVELQDKAIERHGVLCFGALGVGGSKMKLHQAAIAKLFQTNDVLLDAEQIFDLAAAL